jgi:polar amino acid transport system permease protein
MRVRPRHRERDIVAWFGSGKFALAAALAPSCTVIAAQSLLVAPLAALFGSELGAQLARGIATTYLIGGVSIIVGTTGGFLIAYLLRFLSRGRKIMRAFMTILLYSAMSVPVYVLLIYGQAYILNQILLAVTVLSANLAVFVAKLVLSGFSSIRPEQLWAARITGARGLNILLDFEGRAIWRVSGAAISNEWATTLKLTSLIGVVGVYDIMNVAKNHAENSYDATIFLVVFVVYAVLTIPLFIAADVTQRRAT